MVEQDLAYAAGFFDGEGCACICKNLSVKVMVSQKLPEVLFWFKVNFGGNVHLQGKNQGAARWGLYNKKELLEFFLKIRPYLKVKLIDTDFCIRMLEISNDNHTRPQLKNGLYAKNPNGEERDKIYAEYKSYRRKVKDFTS
jgi:hypothetical protein